MYKIADPVDVEWPDGAAVAEDDASMSITTTLYELIAAIRDVVGPDNDNLVVATAVHMLSSRWTTFLGTMGASRPLVG